MKFIVGLGNPGSDYDRTRHNVGFDVVDRLARRLAPGEVARSRFDAVVIETRLGEEKLLLVKPQTMMNRSGRSVSEAITFYKADVGNDLLVIMDDIHLDCGAVRLRPDGSDGGHNGIADISARLGTNDWARLRIGIDEPGVIEQSRYVLGRFTSEQTEQMEVSLETAVHAATLWAEQDCDAAMNMFNTRATPAETTRNTE